MQALPWTRHSAPIFGRVLRSRIPIAEPNSAAKEPAIDVKTIIARFAGVKKKSDLLSTLEKAMEDVETEYGKLQAEKDKFAKRTNELLKEIGSHDTLGIMAFEDYKSTSSRRLKMTQCFGSCRPLPLTR